MSALSPTVSTSPVELLLSRLEGVRANGSGRWIAKCPAHADKRPSLSIAEGADGRLLVHDFSGCDMHSILAAVGLEAKDLFPPRPRDLSPAERHELRMHARMAGWCAALAVLSFEAQIVADLACQIVAGAQLSDADHARVVVAVERIQSAKAVLS